MGNPIYHSDFLKDDGAIDVAIEKLLKLNKTHEGVLGSIVKRLEDLEAIVKKSDATNEKGKETIDEQAKSVSKLEKAVDRYLESIDKNAKKIEEIREATKKQNKENRLNVKLANSAKGSYNQLSAQYAINKIRINAMTEAERELAEETEGLITKTREMYEEMKVLQKETGKSQLNVGNYKESVKEAIQELNGFSPASQKAFGGLSLLKSGFDLISKHPLIAVLGVLVSVMGAIFRAFQRSQTGAEFLNRSMAVLEGLFMSLIPIGESLAQTITSAFEDPQQAVADLWQTIKENIVKSTEIAEN